MAHAHLDVHRLQELERGGAIQVAIQAGGIGELGGRKTGHEVLRVSRRKADEPSACGEGDGRESYTAQMTGRQIIAAASVTLALGLSAQSQTRPDYPIKPVSFTAVRLTDDFWAPRIEINRTSSIPSAFEQCELTGRVALFERAAAVLRGEPNVDKRPPGYPFDETDLYKVIEGASYSLSVTPDPKLDAYVDGLIAKIAAAQEPDGYIYTTRTIDPKNPHRWAGPERWVLERDDSHELYDLGHLFEAAVAHHLATGKRDAARRGDQGRRPARADVRSRQADDLAWTPDHRDGPREAVSRHRQRQLSRAREVPARRARPRPVPRRRARQPARPQLQPGALEGDRTERAGGPRGAGRLHVFGHGGCRRRHRRSRRCARPANASGIT